MEAVPITVELGELPSVTPENSASTIRLNIKIVKIYYGFHEQISQMLERLQRDLK